MKAIFLVMKESDNLEAVLKAWHKAGLTGTTALESFGMGPSGRAHETEDSLPVFGSVMGYLRSRRPRSYTLFSIVEEDRLVDEAIRAAEGILGDLTEEGKGILFVVPIEKVIGYRRQES